MALSKVGKNQVDQSASLTVDSDLTVDTNTLYVDSTNNRVGIGTSSPKTRLQSSAGGVLNAPSLGSSSTNAPLYLTNNDTAYGLVVGNNSADGHVWLQAQRTDGTATAYNITLNEAGGSVGIGTASPNANLHTQGSSTNIVSMQVQNTEGTGSRLDMYAFGSSPAVQSAHRAAVYQWTGAGIDLWTRTGDLHFGTNNIQRMQIDSSGNVGIGVVPTTDHNPVVEALQIGSTANLFGRNDAEITTLTSNSYLSIAGYPKYITTNEASEYIQTGGNHIWFNAPSGTAGAACTQTERMRIDSSGFLRCVGVYNQSAADSANVVVDSTGNIYRSTSALKYKQDIRDIEEIDISQFRPIRYKSNLNRDDQTKDHFGFIADEAHDAGYTELVSYGAVDEETGIAEVEGFRYDRMTVLLTKVVQQQQATITALEARIAALEAN